MLQKKLSTMQTADAANLVKVQFFILLGILLLGYLLHSIMGFQYIIVYGVLLMGWLAYENGGNDVSKGVATLVADKILNYFQAILYGTVMTILGAFTSIWVTSKLVKLFTSGIISDSVHVESVFAFAAISGAVLWLILATKFSMPVSTTHAVFGAIVGVGAIMYGVNNIKWSAVNSKILIPLLFSPFISIALSFLIKKIFSLISLNNLKLLHLLSSGATSFARALNDTPKIVAVGYSILIAAGYSSSALPALYIIVGITMAIGSFIKGLLIVRFLAEKVSKMEDRDGLIANLTTAVLVITSSKLGLPVSTTHVSTSAIIGTGLKKGLKAVSWTAVRDVVTAWCVTLPVAAFFSILSYYLITILIHLLN